MQITFIAYIKLMEVAAVELAANPMDKLLAKYVEAPGARQIERLFKPTSFSLETTPSPYLAASSKKRCLNMNVTHEDQYQPQCGQTALARNRGMDPCHNTHGGCRGRYNKNFRPPQRSNTNSWFTPITSRGAQ
jgi:hypothetical protein